MKSILIAVLAVAAAVAVQAAPAKPAAPAKAAGAVREFKTVNIEVKGEKIWSPSFFVVKKGDKVKITLVNTASGIHAFAIDGYPVNVQVNNAEGDNSKVVEFTANKAGIFRIYCSMHAGHVGGQLLVLP
ncbi:MAG: cupredoxin domain-containing protein [Elusimicrobia bacterium]|nr:cupredoxin domain-containing protein [Elusimicrobiota bacterium]MDE2510870.1 cupredoxin domain-containing protein [Elusimicrobiota bacterium]